MSDRVFTWQFKRKNLGAARCLVCHEAFEKAVPHQKYCKPDCKMVAQIRAAKKRRAMTTKAKGEK